MKISGLKALFKSVRGTPKGVIKTGIMNSCSFYKNSSCGKADDSIEVICYKLRILTHVIEKALSLPNVRKGFGKEKVKSLLELLDKYIEKSDNCYDHQAFLYAVAALKVYVDNAKINECDVSFIDFNKYKDYADASVISGIDYFDAWEHNSHAATADFKNFAENRHSVRGFSDEPVPEKLVRAAIELAQTAPSACNRQSARVIHITDKSLCKQILEIQGGAKGHTDTELFLIASDLNLYHYVTEMNTPYVDAGIFIMNLLYSLNYYGIGACPLIWDDYSEKGKKLRQILSIPENLHISAVVQFGMYPDGKCKYAVSKRREFEAVYFTENSFNKQ